MPRPAQPTPGSGPPDSVQRHVAETVAADVVEFDVFAFVAKRIQDGLLGQSAQEQSGRVGLGVAADHHDFLAHFRQGRYRVLRGRRLADAAFAVDCNLSHGLSFS